MDEIKINYSFRRKKYRVYYDQYSSVDIAREELERFDGKSNYIKIRKFLLLEKIRILKDLSRQEWWRNRYNKEWLLKNADEYNDLEPYLEKTSRADLIDEIINDRQCLANKNQGGGRCQK